MHSRTVSLIIGSLIASFASFSDAKGGSCREIFQGTTTIKSIKMVKTRDVKKTKIMNERSPETVYEAFQIKLHSLRDHLKPIKTPEDLAHFLADKKQGGKEGRQYVFFTEVFGPLLKNYEGNSKEHEPNDYLGREVKVLSDLYFKTIEDAMGRYSQEVETLQAYESFQLKIENSDSNKDFKAYLKNNVDQSLENLFNLMQEQSWIGDGNALQFTKIEKQISKLPWPESIAKQQKEFFKSTRKLFERYDFKMKKELKEVLEESPWNYDRNMEQGLHEVRRLVRNVLIAMLAYPQAFSYSKSLSEGLNFKVGTSAFDIANASYQKILKNGGPLKELSVQKKGTIIVDPDLVFYLSGLVDQLGSLKSKSEIYFKLQTEIKNFLAGSENQVPGIIERGLQQEPITVRSSDKEIESYIIEISQNTEPGSSLNLSETFVAGSTNPFKEIQSKTLELLKPFWKLEPLKAFEEASDQAKEYWKNRQ